VSETKWFRDVLLRPGVVRALVKVLSTKTHWGPGTDLSQETLVLLATWLRDKRRKLWKDPGGTDYPSWLEALAAARCFAWSLLEGDTGVACGGYKNCLACARLEPKSRGDEFSGTRAILGIYNWQHVPAPQG